MSDGVTTAIGFAAAFGTTVAFVPQVIKSWRSMRVDDLSLLLLIFFTSGTTLWVVYGVLRSDIVVIIANVFTTALVASLLFLKIRMLARRL
jgi:MtN3 and saliva related transmembrane protein